MKSILIFLTFLFTLGINLSQDTTSTNQEHILIAIEDSLRGKSFFGEDSAWINLQLQIHNEPFKNSNIKYKLVKIGKRDFIEGPHANYTINIKKPIVTFDYGDSAYSVFGQKFYTYIGNSSWGYCPEYHLIRVNKLQSIKETFDNPNLGRYCKHGYDSWRAIPCINCEKELEGVNLDAKLKIREPNTCEHGWDMNRGLACGQCLHNYKIQHDSSYRANDSLKKLKFQPQIIDCNHGHICCETSFCKCCPDNLRKKDVSFEIHVTESLVCHHDYDKNLDQLCPQCIHEVMMSKDSTLKPYADYFPKIDTSITKTIPLDCNHGHLCCQVNCPCCPDGASIRAIRIKAIMNSKCAHSHNCCSSNCECCPSLTKKERRKLIRKKKRTYRRNIRYIRRKNRKTRRNR